MGSNLINALKRGIPVVFAVLVLAIFLGTPALVSAMDEGWYDPQGWFNKGGSIENESDWYSATYGYGRGERFSEIREYYEEQYPATSDPGLEKTPYAMDSQYRGTYGPVSRSFGEGYEGRPAGLEHPYGYYYPYEYYYSESAPYGYYWEDYRRTEDVSTDRAMKRAPQVPYGNYPRQPGFARFEPGMGLGYEPYGNSEQRGLWYSNAWSDNLYGDAVAKAEERGDAFPRESTYGYYEGSQSDVHHYYTSDWDRRGGELERWW